MTAWTLAIALLAIGLIDGGFSGFRASLGRDARIDHRTDDRVGARRGIAVAAAGLAPAVILALTVTARDGAALDLFRDAGVKMLAVYAGYSVVMLTAMASYATLPWRWRFLATSMIMGPLSLVRPLIAVAGAALAIAASHDGRVAWCCGLAVIGVLAVEPVVSRVWYRPVVVPR